MKSEVQRIKVLKHQKAFIDSDYRHTGLVAGFGAGKSHAGVYKTIKKKVQHDGIDVAYYLPTYPLIRDIAFPKFSEGLTEMGIPFTLNRTDKEFQTPYGRIILRSMDNPDLIVGYEVGYSLIDEADILSKDKMNDVFVRVLARNRKKLTDGSKNSLDFVSTPEGFKFLHEFFITKKTDDKILIKGKTYDNPYLPEDFIKSLEESYSPQQLEAYLNGEFVNLTSGTVYNEFKRDLHHSARSVEKTDKLHIGMDFNITNMSAVVYVVDGNIKTAVDEFTGVYDTFSLAGQIKSKYPDHNIIIYPDASGSARSTSGKSDHQILREHGFQVISPTKNPSVRDRINATNTALRKMELMVNTFQCSRFTDALERLAYKGGEPDKSSGFDHITDAGTYFIVNSTKKISYKLG